MDWHQLRQVACWGSVAAHKVLPPKACAMRAFKFGAESPNRGSSRLGRPWDILAAALEEARAMMQAEEDELQACNIPGNNVEGSVDADDKQSVSGSE